MKSTNYVLCGLLLTLLQALGSVKTANILSLIEVLPADQQIWHDAVIKGLTDRGHKVTIVSGGGSTMNSKSPQLTKIHLEQVKPTLEGVNDAQNHFTNKWLSPFERVLHWYDKQMRICKGVLTSDGLLELTALARGSGVEEPFDVILYDATHGRSCLLAFAQLFENVPIVAVSASHITPDLLEVVRGTQQQPATVPHFTTTHAERMNFFERLHNTFVYAFANFYRQYTVASVQEALLSQHEALQSANVKSDLAQLSERIKIVLVNDHPALDYVHSLPPNVIPVAGLQFDNINRPLLVDMQAFIDNSQEGVFIITLRGALLTQQTINRVLEAVDSFPEYGFVWGVNKIMIPDDDRKNLYVGKWLKKSNILAQHQVKGVITGGSQMEVQEAVYQGVPIITVKNVIQHPSIAKRVESLGLGINVDLSSNADNLQKAIKALTSHPNYAENVKSRQMAFRNRPQNPLDVALWWIEHVMTHAQAGDYLYSQALAESSFLSLHSFDAVSVAAIFVALFILNCFIVMKGLKSQSGSSSSSSKKKLENKDKSERSEKRSKSKKANESQKKKQ